MLYAFWMSLNVIDFQTREYHFVFFRNYGEIFTDSRTANSFITTIYFSISTIIVTIVLSFLLALLLNQDVPGQAFFRAILLIPWAIPSISNGLMWKWMFNARSGIINNLLISLGLLDRFENWLTHLFWALAIVVIAMVYKQLPFVTFLFIATLQTIPDQLYEAAKIDGAGPLKRLFFITIPLVRPSMVIILIILSVATLKAFDMIFILTHGGPADATLVANYLAYEKTFTRLDFGGGAAIAFVISIIILLINLGYFKTLYKEVRYE
jgi:ABC-type sugar transport system permease subunit